MTTISIREAAVRSGLPETEIRIKANLGYFESRENPFDMGIDQDSFDQYLVNKQPPVNGQQEMIIRKKERKPMKMYSECILITPKLAEEWLKTNEKNYRKIYWPRVDAYVRAMQGGNWILTHQGISLDEEGKLMDGQHRLYAVVISKIPVKMMVTFNQPRTNELVFDEQKPRNFDTHAAYHNSPYRHTALAIARILEFGINGRPTLQTAEMFAIIDKYKEGIVFALRGQSRGYVPAPSCAVVAQAYYCSDDHDRIDQFITVLTTGKAVGSGDDAAILLRNLIFMDRERDRKILYCKTQSALDAFLNRRPITKLYARDGLFPIKTNAAGRVVPA